MSKAKAKKSKNPVDEQLDELFNDTWEDVESSSFEEVPDGTYQVKVNSATINNAKSSGRLQCSWDFIIVEGDRAGSHIFMHQGMDTEDSLSYFKGTLARLGYEDPKSKKELIELLEEIVEGPTFALIKVSTRKKRIKGEVQEFQNKRLIKALSSDEVDLDEDLDLPEDETEETEPDGKFKEGDQVEAEFNGEVYTGVVIKVTNDGVDVEFEDGETLAMSPEDLTAAPPEEEAETETEDEDEDGCSLLSMKFSPADKKAVKELAKEHDFDPDDYSDEAELLCEIGDYCGLSGSFKSPSVLIKAINSL